MTTVMIMMKIKEKRKLSGLSIRELSKLSGVSKTHISDVETGKKIPTIDVLCRIAKALKLEPEDLYECNYK